VTQVETARGPIDTTALGPTLMHEHVFVLSPEIAGNYPGDWDEEARVAQAVQKLDELHAAGIDTIADPTVVGLGRSAHPADSLADRSADRGRYRALHLQRGSPLLRLPRSRGLSNNGTVSGVSE
jgi:Phosphotriesterase family